MHEYEFEHSPTGNRNEAFEGSRQILFGLEELLSEEPLVARVRFLLEKLHFDEHTRDEVLGDGFLIFKSLGEFSIGVDLEVLLLAPEIENRVAALLGLIETIEPQPLLNNIRLLLKFARFDAKNESEVTNLLTSLLTELGSSSQVAKFAILKSLFLERNKFVALKKVTELYELIYGLPIFDRFRKMVEHSVTLQSDVQIWQFLFEATGVQFFRQIKKTRQDFPKANLAEAMSRGQIKSKRWLASNLKTYMPAGVANIHVMCGWYGTLAECIWLEIGEDRVAKITSYDKDPSCKPVAEMIHRFRPRERFEAVTLDVLDLKISNVEGLDCVINTSCEHLDRFAEWYAGIPTGTFVVLQSNDFFAAKDHCNCVAGLEQFKAMAPMTKLCFEGELPLEKYKRFMLIGTK